MTTEESKRQMIDAEIELGRNEIRSDKLDISYGELANMYSAGELVIGPEYQRLFRWELTQKTRFIESILLGFPTPAIFVAEDANGVWELVDGLQRTSTIIEFMGLLKNAEGTVMPPTRLVKAGHAPLLPSLDGACFEDMSQQARLSIKRAGCRVEVIKVGSKQGMKYELFERLNTGGSGLTDQEVRNCIFRASNPEFVEWVDSLANYPPFANNLGLSDYQKSTMFDRELVLRFFTMKNAWKEFEHDVGPFITSFVRDVVEGKRDFDRAMEQEVFKTTFATIGEAMEEDSWRHSRDGRHRGPLSVYVFETISIGVAANIASLRNVGGAALRDRITRFKEEARFVDNTGAGANIKSKLVNRIGFALDFFKV